MEIIKLNLIPSGVNPVCHAKQYDEGRVIRIDLFDGLTPYVLKSGDTVSLNVRKPDNTIIDTTLTATQGNTYVNLVTTEQICAVVGYNLCTLKITNGSVDIGTLDFIMQVARDVLADGIPSQSVIEDLDALVAEAVAEDLGDNYYTKTEIDDFIDDLSEVDSDLTRKINNISNEVDSGYLNIDAVTNASWSQKVIANNITYKEGVVYTFVATAPESQRIYLSVLDSNNNALITQNVIAQSTTFTLTPTETLSGCYIDYRSDAANKSINLKCTSSEGLQSQINALSNEIDNFEVPDNSITPIKTSFMQYRHSDNLFDKDTMSQHGKWYVRQTNTNKIIWQENQYTGDYTGCCIDVSGASKVHVVASTSSLNKIFYNYAFANDNMIADSSFTVVNQTFANVTGNSFSIDIPSNAKYFIFNIKDSENNMKISVNVGSEPLPYNDFYEYYQMPNLDFEDLEAIKSKLENVNISNIHRIVIGENLYSVVGDTLQIFYDAIIESDEPYILKFYCNKGKNYPKYWEFTPSSEDIGNHTITITLLNYNNEILDEKIVALKVVSGANPQAQTNILCVGDSTMQWGNIPIEASRRFKGTTGATNSSSPSPLNYSNLSLVGRKENSDNTVGWEGTGGWTFSSYIGSGVKAVRFTITDGTNLNIGDTYSIGTLRFDISEINVVGGSGEIRTIYAYDTSSQSMSGVSQSGTLTKVRGNGQSTITYTAYTEEYYQPFWNENTNQFDITSYVSDYCNNACDYVCILLGINSLISGSPFMSFDAIKNNMITLLSDISGQLPNAKILLSTLPLASINGGIGSNYGSGGNSGAYDANGFNHKIFSWNALLTDLEKDGTLASYNTYLVNAHAQFDVINSMQTGSKLVNSRSTVNETIQTNAVHPADIGYWQLSDAIVFRPVLCLN